MIVYNINIIAKKIHKLFNIIIIKFIFEYKYLVFILVFIANPSPIV